MTSGDFGDFLRSFRTAKMIRPRIKTPQTEREIISGREKEGEVERVSSATVLVPVVSATDVSEDEARLTSGTAGISEDSLMETFSPATYKL